MNVFGIGSGGAQKRIGDYLVEMGFIAPSQAELPPAELRRLVGDDKYYHALAKKYGKTFIPTKEFRPQPEAMGLLVAEWVQAGLIPYSVERGRLYIATDDPEARMAPYHNLRNNLRSYEVYLQYVSTPQAIEAAKARILAHLQEQEVKKRLPVFSASSPQGAAGEEEDLYGAGNLLQSILEEAKASGASDVHLERLVFGHGSSGPGVRLRVNGRLEVYRLYEPAVFEALLTKVKILASMRLDERRLPQDGRVSMPSTRFSRIEARVSVVPSLRGEEAVIRLLPTEGYIPDLEKVIADPEILDLYQKVIHQPYGIFLVTGPTGSGKSTTLAAMLKRVIQTRGGKVLTVEDPIEYRLPGASQVQVQEEIGLTFSRALRAFLRQDPDVIMVGELRDSETARIATEAAMTGHLVLATLHVNNAVGVFRRLEQMGIERYKVTDALLGASAQRLIPKLCPTCSLPDEEAREKVGGEPRKPGYRPDCPTCRGKGYVGRLGVQEAFLLDHKTKEKVSEASESTVSLVLERSLRERPEGYKVMYERGIPFVRQGVISLRDLEEATRVL